MDSATNERINEVHFKSDCRLSFADMSTVDMSTSEVL